jgi:hypothetical protein
MNSDFERIWREVVSTYVMYIILVLAWWDWGRTQTKHLLTVRLLFYPYTKLLSRLFRTSEPHSFYPTLTGLLLATELVLPSWYRYLFCPASLPPLP